MSIISFKDDLKLQYRSRGMIYNPIQEHGVIQKVDVYAQTRLTDTPKGLQRFSKYETTFAKKDLVDVLWEKDGLQPAKINGFAWVKVDKHVCELMGKVKPLAERESYFVAIESLQKRELKPIASVEPKAKKQRRV